MKRGCAEPLLVKFFMDFNEVKSIEFMFKDIKSETADIILTKQYPTDCTLDSDTNIISIPFTEEDTRLFSGRFYMDTKIIMNDDTTPETDIVTLNMKPTLFPQAYEDTH